MKRQDYLLVSTMASMLSEVELKRVRVDRDIELFNLIHLSIHANENVLLIGDRGQGKTFLARLYQLELLENYPEVFPVRIDLSSLRFYTQDNNYFLRSLPFLILNQLCKEIWVSILKKDYSMLLLTNQNPEKINLFKSKSERRVIDLHNLLKKEEQKYQNEMISKIGASFGINSEINTKANEEWTQRSLLNFEVLELIRELKDTVLKKYSKNKIILICDEANKLAEEEQQQILQNYLDFFGSNQFNFLPVERNSDEIKRVAESNKLFRIMELEGFGSIDHVKQLISNSFKFDDIVISEETFDLLFQAFNGHPFNTMDAFCRCINLYLDGNKNEIDSSIAKSAIARVIEQLNEMNKLKPNKK